MTTQKQHRHTWRTRVEENPPGWTVAERSLVAYCATCPVVAGPVGRA